MALSKRDKLIDSAGCGDLIAVKELINGDNSIIDSVDRESRTALRYAAWRDHRDVVTYLCEQGANVNSVAADEMTPLMAAACYGYGDTAKILMDHKAEVNRITARKGKSALIFIAGEEDPQLNRYFACAQQLIAYGADINIQDHSGNTALMYTRLNSKIFDLLIEAKANLELKDNNGKTVFLKLCSHDTDLLRLKQLTDKGVNVNAQDSKGNSALDLILASVASDELIKKRISILFDAKSPAFDAALKERALTKAMNENELKKVTLLLSFGVKPVKQTHMQALAFAYETGTFDDVFLTDVKDEKSDQNKEDVLDKEGNSLLMRAIKDEKYAIASKLIKYSKLNIKNKNNQSPLQLAINSGEEALVTQLIAAGANPNEQHKQMDSLLMKNINNKKMALILIQKGADLEFIRKSDGMTPLMQAVSICSEELVKAILDKNPRNLNYKNTDDKTAFYIAVEEGLTDGRYTGIVKAMIAANANPLILCRSHYSLTVFDIGRLTSHFGDELEVYKAKLEEQASKSKLSGAPHALTFKPAPEIPKAPCAKTAEPAASTVSDFLCQLFKK